MPHIPATLRGRRTLHVPRALTVALALAVAFALTAAPLLSMAGAARADGDPASDVLLIDNVFYSYVPPVSNAITAALNTTVGRAHAVGFPIKVALIEAPLDLGAIPQLFGKPEAYARFLDVEISYNSVAKLLVVMPQGFGTFASGPVSALQGIHIDTAAQSDGLAEAAIPAIGKLAKLAGHPIALPAVPGESSGGGGGGGGGGGPGAALGLVAAIAIVTLGAVAVIRRRSRRRAVTHAGEADDTGPTAGPVV